MKTVLSLLTLFSIQMASAEQSICPDVEGTYVNDSGSLLTLEFRKTSGGEVLISTTQQSPESKPTVVASPLDGKTEVVLPPPRPGLAEMKSVSHCEPGKIVALIYAQGTELYQIELAPVEGGITTTVKSSVPILNQPPLFSKKVK